MSPTNIRTPKGEDESDYYITESKGTYNTDYISIDEIRRQLEKMKHGKAPGPDGLEV